jgi:hypothetical protein
MSAAGNTGWGSPAVSVACVIASVPPTFESALNAPESTPSITDGALKLIILRYKAGFLGCVDPGVDIDPTNRAPVTISDRRPSECRSTLASWCSRDRPSGDDQ